MRFLSSLVVLFLVSAPGFNAQAANEWKNPDAQEPPKKRRVTPAAPPRQAPPPAPAPAQASVPAPVLEGQLSLQAVRVCNYQLSYVDKGSGGKIDGSFYLPGIPDGYAMIGAYAQGNYDKPSDCILAVKPANEQSISLLQIPGNWNRVWTDKGSGASMDGSIWHPTPQSNNYVCLGSIAKKGYKQPNLSNYVCVHRCLVESIPVNYPVWSTKGTGSKQKTNVYKLHNSNSFFAVPGKNSPASLTDIKGNMSCSF
jgi:hypothetical protein